MNYSLVLSIFLSLIGAYLAQSTPPVLHQRQNAQYTSIDALKDRYIQLEKALWQVIRGGADQTNVLTRIHDVHLTFFAENFNNKGVEFDIFDPHQKILHNEINEINLTLAVVNNMYLHANSKDFSREQTIGFARNGVNFTKRMENIFNVTEYTDFFSTISRKAELQNCLLSAKGIKSAQQVIYENYVDISVAQLKAYALTQLSYMFLTVYGISNYVMSAQNLQFTYKQRTTKTQDKVRQLLFYANRDVWLCDTDNFEFKSYYDEVTRLLQGYVDNEVNLNPINDCKQTCPDYQLAQQYLCYNGSYCDVPDEPTKEKRRCKGTIVNCTSFGPDMNICPSDDPNRRYDYIKYDSGRILGASLGEPEPTCKNTVTRTCSWTRWFVQCSNCFCYCDEQGPKSDRYFSLRPVLSNTDQNMIITGVAIRKHFRVFHWRITERQLVANGELKVVNKDWSSWKAGDFFNIEDPSVSDGIDYHTLSWQNRSINLDVITGPPGTVVTGVRFGLFKRHLSLQIRVTRFDFTTGRLEDVRNSQWISNDLEERIQIVLEKPKVSIKSQSKSIPDVRENTYIDFQPTDPDEDAAQSTVPFIDTQLVEPHNPTLLSGLGLYYKGQPHMGGFIAPKVVTYDYTDYLKSSSLF